MDVYSTFYKLLLFAFLCSISVDAQSRRARVSLINNGYEGVLIAIKRDVPKDWKLIEGIKVCDFLMNTCTTDPYL